MKFLYTFITIFALSATVPTEAKAQQKPDISVEKPENVCAGQTTVTVKVTKEHTPYKYVKVEFGDNRESYITADGGRELKHIYLEKGSYEITLQTFYQDGTQDAEKTSVATVTVGMTPDLSLDEDLKTAQLNAVSNASSFVWYSVDRKGTETKLQNTEAVLNYLESGTYKVEAVSADGCKVSESKSVVYQKNMQADFSAIIVSNNVITPNNDGINDVLAIEDLGEYKEPCEVKIFSKNGKLVYENSNYTNTDGFQGKDDKGNDLFAGTYYYVIKSKGRRGVTGFVDIIR
jgi:gliding motility-associated-like protein